MLVLICCVIMIGLTKIQFVNNSFSIFLLLVYLMIFCFQLFFYYIKKLHSTVCKRQNNILQGIHDIMLVLIYGVIMIRLTKNEIFQ